MVKPPTGQAYTPPPSPYFVLRRPTAVMGDAAHRTSTYPPTTTKQRAWSRLQSTARLQCRCSLIGTSTNLWAEQRAGAAARREQAGERRGAARASGPGAADGTAHICVRARRGGRRGAHIYQGPALARARATTTRRPVARARPLAARARAHAPLAEDVDVARPPLDALVRRLGCLLLGVFATARAALPTVLLD